VKTYLADVLTGGFAPHIDAVAYTHIKDVKHLTILLSVDPSNLQNGGLEVVDGSHLMDVPINKTTNCIEPSWVESHVWTPVELEAGKLSHKQIHRTKHELMSFDARPASHLHFLPRPPQWAQQEQI
jgi:hypothetical protein